MKLHEILHELADAVTFTDNRRGEIHAAIDELAHGSAPAETPEPPAPAGPAPVSPAQ